jgi:hypothetical protein
LGVQGHHEQALDVSLRISDPSVFAYIRKFHLYGAAGRDASRLLNVDAAQAVQLFVDNHEAVSSDVVGSEVLAMQRRAEAAGNEDEAAVWRERMFAYLHALFEKEKRASHGFHDLQARVVCCLCLGASLAMFIARAACAAAMQFAQARTSCRLASFGMLGRSRPSNCIAAL